MTWRTGAMRCTCTVVSVITPRRPSLPRIISCTLGPESRPGIGLVTATPSGWTMRSPRTMSSMSPYLSDCIPEERVAAQPPRVE